MRPAVSNRARARSNAAEGPDREKGTRWRDHKTRLWIAAIAGALALLLLWLSGGSRETGHESARDTLGQPLVERRSADGYELVSTSWDPEDLAPIEAAEARDPEELRLLNEARERWQNLDVAIQGR